MKVFVAGGTGVVGRPTVTRLVKSGYDVSVLVRSEAKAALVAALGATPVRGSLFDAEGLRSAVAGHEVVINLATHIPPVTAMARLSSWAENDRVRTEGSRLLVDAALAAGARRYVQESIAFAYTDGGGDWIDEDAPLDGTAPYFAALQAAEASAARFTAAGGTGVVLRFGMFHTAGSDQSAAMLAATRWGFAAVPGPAGSYVAFVHVDDAAAAVVAALDAPAGTYNVVDDEPLTRAGYAAAWQAALDDPGRVRMPPAFVNRMAGRSVPQAVTSQRVSNRRFREATGWAPRYPSAREGLAQIVIAAREPRRLRSRLGALALIVLGIGSLMVGVWALAAPVAFHESFPGFGHHWVAPDGPFNEHLLRDVGGLNLGLAAVAFLAVASMTLPLVRAAAIAHLLFGVPHLLFHATHLGHFATGDAVALVASLAVPVAAAVTVLVLSRRPAPPAGARPADTGHDRRSMRLNRSGLG
jgi:nucleoside-diphosphate-sugar epimerase